MITEDCYIPYSAGTLPFARSVLVLAPHPDDEIFGCGGSLALYRQTGASIYVHVLSDGAGFAARENREAIQQMRQAETNAALASLGVAPATYAGMADRSLSERPDLSQNILQKVQELRPDVLLAPSLWEIHPDHRATSCAAWLAAIELQRQGEAVPTLLFYEVGSPQQPDLLVDITAVWLHKQRAFQCFHSQLAQQDYDRHIEALNTFRTYTLPKSVRYAEAFGQVTPGELGEMTLQGEHLASRAIKKWLEIKLTAGDPRVGTWPIGLELQKLESQRLRAILEAAESELDEARQLNRQLLNSNSWRVTAALRWIRRLFKR